VKVLFLDIDGVLNSVRSATVLGNIPHDVTPKGLALFDMQAVELVRGLCRDGRVKIVLSSTWRLHDDWEAIGPALGLPIIDRTGRYYEGPTDTCRRGREIQAWLDMHPEVESYAIVDDDSDMLPGQMEFFAQTSGFDGLTWAPFTKLCSILNISEYDCRRTTPTSDAQAGQEGPR